ncbi:MAG: ATP phosphoribosyltransferase regulatory subunit, partial [Alphaproteobacteria bacterium]|nr:ATP phosphoribosyltransferase regulatory subunit [Alphaproteobacteria bacterium]
MVDATRALLPAGLQDTLAPSAEQEFNTIATLMQCFALYGYDQVAPPLVEFEDTLLAGVGAVEGRRMFRLQDPVSHRMMGIRTDITTQVARVAATRLVSAPRPLRLSYAGQVLRVKGGQTRSEREVGQAGIELVGAQGLAGEVEVLLVGVEALAKAGAADISVDVTLPGLVPLICEELGIGEENAAQIRAALDDKDIGALNEVGGPEGKLFRGLLAAGGVAQQAIEALRSLDLPEKASAEVDHLAALVNEVQEALPDLPITIDPGEYRNFEYHPGVCFTLFSRSARAELARGGVYEVVLDARENDPAIGLTVYVDSLMRALPRPGRGKRVFLPRGTGRDVIAKLHEEGWRTAIPDIGLPNAKNSTLAVDLTELVADGHDRFRLSTTMRLYWDAAFYTVDDVHGDG